MKISYALILVVIISFYSIELKSGRLFDSFAAGAVTVGAAVTAPARVLIEYGEGKQAKKQLEVSNNIILGQNEKTGELVKAIEGNTHVTQQTLEGVEKIAQNGETTNNMLDKLSNQENFKLATNAFLIVSSSVHLGTSMYKFYHYMWPTEEEKIAAQTAEEQAGKQLAILQAEGPMNKCLAINSQSAKDAEGMPMVCKIECEKFAQAAGPEAFLRLKKSFNRCYNVNTH